MTEREKESECRYYCASCGKRFVSLDGMYKGGGTKWLHDEDAEGTAACGPVLESQTTSDKSETPQMWIEQLEGVLRALAEGDDWSRPDRDFAPRTLHEATRVLHKLKASVAIAVREAEQRALRDAAEAIPTNWLDSLLTQDSIGQPPYDCPAIERLLLGIKDRLRARADALTLQE